MRTYLSLKNIFSPLLGRFVRQFPHFPTKKIASAPADAGTAGKGRKIAFAWSLLRKGLLNCLSVTNRQVEQAGAEVPDKVRLLLRAIDPGHGLGGGVHGQQTPGH